MSKPSLVIMAAGMGSRYGGLKQLDGFGPSGETIVEYSIYDAIRAGFGKVLFIIRKDIEESFKEVYLNRITGIEIDYVCQEMTMLPCGFSAPAEREKPWGTGHAVYVTKNKIDGPFAIINADDFYGRNSFDIMAKKLKAIDNSKTSALLVGFVLKNTLSENGRVSRGICELKEDGCLKKITERTHIFKREDGRAFYEENEERYNLSGEETVSMNLMGFTSPVFSLIEEKFIDFLNDDTNDLKSEFYLPIVLDTMCKRDYDIPVPISQESWFGVTYKEDKAITIDKLRALVDIGVYPENLWG